MELGLKGKVTSVTGASKGMGVAALRVFLTSARASSITGALMQVDGGATRCI
jgi:NAD(P)-dependent dehydrogenase (short-subunit alcohol dehydrogenase family)